MPKARETCTECSRRRQKCDKGNPCGRCVARGCADRCSREWSNAGVRRTSSIAQTSPIEVDERQVSAVHEHNRDSFSSHISIANVASNDWQNADATALEFMAWGRRRNSEEASEEVQNRLPGFTDNLKTRVMHLELLLPSTAQLWQLVNFHEKKLLWYHGCMNGEQFNLELRNRLRAQQATDESILRIDPKDLVWTALLFSILAGSATCATEKTITKWGFGREEISKLSRQWFLAAKTSLELGNYTSIHRLQSVQAIATLTMCAHTLGFSNDQSILLGAALKIAQSLGLHRLKLESDEDVDETASEQQRQSLMQKEVGRRLWSQLCVQDWFSIPFADAHCIHPRHFTTVRPANRDYITMQRIPDMIPTYVSYNNYLYEIALIIAQLHERVLQCNTAMTRYEQVLEYDSRMRELATRGRPAYFDVTVPIDPTWPIFVPWARRSLTICFAHKIMMIHRSFLAQSFTNMAFSFTRMTCIAAAKTILNEAKVERDKNGPIIWIDQAFCVAAGITLALDASHRTSRDAEYQLHRHLVQECIQMLESHGHGTIASRGIQLLRVLRSRSDIITSSPRQATTTVDNTGGLQSANGFLNTIYGTNTYHTQIGPDQIFSTDHRYGASSSGADFPIDGFGELFPASTGFSNAFIEELFDFRPE